MFIVSFVYAALTVSPSLSKSLTENEQVTVTVTVSNQAGGSAESNIVTELSGSPSWFSVVTACSSIDSLSAAQSKTSTCIIKPTSTGSDLSLTATSTSQGGTSSSGSTSGINVASQSSSLTASISSDSSVALSATFYVGTTVAAPSANDVANARATISRSGQCEIDTSTVPAQQNLGNITKGTTKSVTNWKLTSSSASGTCTITVNVVSDVGGTATPSKVITVGTSTAGAGAAAGGGAGVGLTGYSVLLTLTGKSIAPQVITEIEKVVVTIPLIVAKEEVNFSIDSQTIAITSMKIKAVNNVTNVNINVSKLASRPRYVVSDAPGVANQYINIDKANVSDADIEKVTIDFKADKIWIKENKINESTISLYRYEINDQWNKLETVKTSEDDTNIYYQAVSPGLSIFSVAGESKVTKAPGLPSQEKITEVFIGKSWMGFVILVGISVAILVGIYLFKMRATSRVKLK